MAGRDVSVLDVQLMRAALKAGARGRPSPNPHVGAVIARGSEIVGEGLHERAGKAHAEIVALRQAGARARGATLYVTLEPCNHEGRTGPCTEALIAAGVARVVIGARDPAPHVPGAVDRLRAAGIEVVCGVQEHDAQRLVADFAKHITTGLPFVQLKAAVTLDGRIATRTGDSRWITGPEARSQAHRLRKQNDAVLVGVGTVLADDPELTVRHVRGIDPLRVVLDSTLRTPLTAKLVRHSSAAPTLLLHGPGAPLEKRAALAALPGIDLAEVPRAAGGALDLDAALREIARRDCVRLLAEGGARLHGALLDGRFVDSVAVFVAPILLGDGDAVPLARGRGSDSITNALRLRDVTTQRFGDDVLIEGDVPGPSPWDGELRKPLRA
jgi:diaminohydroxyphosphoribosylaminopyrimidine deaminase/5-amino-6-(5-phosphoribosylamino)uracil reductase